MRLSRDQQFDSDNPPWLHCISRCVRRAFLCGDGYEHRKAWIERRLKILSRCYAVDLAAYAIMSNHMHIVVRPRPHAVESMTDEEVAMAWWCVRYDVDPIDDVDEGPIDRAQIAELVADKKFIAIWRVRIGSVSWFIRAITEKLSRIANKEDKCAGHFWEARFKSIPLLDVAAIVVCMAYVDLNPIRAQLAEVPEESAFTSVHTRIHQERKQHAQKIKSQSKSKSKPSPKKKTIGGTPPSEMIRMQAVSRNSWLCPVNEITSTGEGDPGFALDTYLKMVDNTGRLIRGDKRGAISRELDAILERLDSNWNSESWCASMTQAGSLPGAVLGKALSVAKEAGRRGLLWMHQCCALFPPRKTQSS